MHVFKNAGLAAVIALGLASGTANAAVLYSNGPANNQVDAWTINFGMAVADSFVLGAPSKLTGADFSVWLYPFNDATSVDWTILDGMPGTGTALSHGTAALTTSSPFMNGYNYWIRTASFALPNITLAAGTYWLELENLVVSGGASGFWDINGGPSSAWENTIGDVTICPDGSPGPGNRCSTTFEILGDASVPEPASALIVFGALALLGSAVKRQYS